MSFPHVARQGFITETALPSVTRADTTASTDAIFLLNSTSTTVTYTNPNFVDASGTINNQTYLFYPYQTSKSPFVGGNGSFMVNSPNNPGMVKVASTTSFGFGTGDFTVECWYWPGEIRSGEKVIVDTRGGSPGQTWIFGVANGGDQPYYNDGTTKNSAYTLTKNKFSHLAWVRKDGTVKIYVDGTTRYTSVSTSTVGQSSAPLTFGADNGGGNAPFNGFVSNLRVSKYAIYDGDFTAPTSDLSPTTSTVFLLNNTGTNYSYPGQTIYDASTLTNWIGYYGRPRVTNFSPYASGGQSIFFNFNTLDGLYFDTNLGFGSADNGWIEFWIFPSANQTASSVNLFSLWGPAAATRQFAITRGDTSARRIQAFVINAAASQTTLDAGTTYIAVDNEWTHIALGKVGTRFDLYINGVSRANSSPAGFTWNTSTYIMPWLGRNPGGIFFDGYVCDLHVMRGTAKYSGNFTPPTSPVTTTTNTVLLLKGTDIWQDTTGSRPLTAVLGTQTIGITTSTPVFPGTTSFIQTGTAITAGLRIPGTLNTASFAFPGDFTVEGWINISTTTNGGQLIGISDNASTANWWFGYTTLGALSWTNAVTSANGVIPVNTWTHLAASRLGSTLSLYVNGSRVAQATNSTNYPISTTIDITVGADFGQNTQIIQGQFTGIRALPYCLYYTDSFTVPTELPTKNVTYFVGTTTSVYGVYQQF